MFLVKIEELRDRHSRIILPLLTLIKGPSVSDLNMALILRSGSTTVNTTMAVFCDSVDYPLITLRSSASDSWAVLPKLSLLKYKRTSESVFYSPTFWVLDTVLKGFVFLMYQAYEYTSSMFAINDSIYGAVFFSLTGLHGLHVFVGVMFLLTFVLINLAKEMETASNDTYVGRGLRNRYDVAQFFFKRKVTRVSSYGVKHFNHRIAFDGAAWY